MIVGLNYANKLRCSQANLCTPVLIFLRRYALMKSCWHMEPAMRPNCAKLLLHLN